MRATVADLEAAVAADAVERWLDGVPAMARPALCRALEIDRSLWQRYRASLASCLVARTMGLDGLAELHAQWARELDARGAPWIAALRALPVATGLVAELHDGADLELAPGGAMAFESEEVVSVRPFPHAGRRDCLRWAWSRGETVRVPDKPAAPAGRDRRLDGGAWKRAVAHLPGMADPLSESAKLMADGLRVIVYGSLEDYEGGFAHIVDLASSTVERSLYTRRPVGSVHDCARRDLLVLSTFGGLVAWRGDQQQELAVQSHSVALSPSGAHVATLGDSLQIWSLESLIRGDGHSLSGLRTCFDPSGDRLVSGRGLFDGRSGRRVAELVPRFGEYLEGGPAAPWFHLGTRYLIAMHSGLQVWDAATGDVTPAGDPRFYPHWVRLAHDRGGTRFAALDRGGTTVTLHAMPTGRVAATLQFDLRGREIAISPDGETLAIQRGGAVEVRRASGALVQRFGDVGDDDKPDHQAPQPVRRCGPTHPGQYDEPTLRFSHDGRRIARFAPDAGWQIWTPGAPGVEQVSDAAFDDVADFAPAWPADWTAEIDSKTVFTHRPSGTQIALPVAGPWRANPAAPRILACKDMHVELRGG